tara:strand:+ start:1053 stop:1322 length:270 start_codon:yes stop_codon:yes gene_type:complete
MNEIWLTLTEKPTIRPLSEGGGDPYGITRIDVNQYLNPRLAKNPLLIVASTTGGYLMIELLKFVLQTVLFGSALLTIIIIFSVAALVSQ